MDPNAEGGPPKADVDTVQAEIKVEQTVRPALCFTLGYPINADVTERLDLFVAFNITSRYTLAFPPWV